MTIHNGTENLPHLRLGVDVFTSGQVSRMLGVASRTVSKWCDLGKLPCYRVGGGRICTRGDRRVNRSALCAFAEERGIPLTLPPLAEGVQVLLVGLLDSLADTLKGTCARVPSLLCLGLALERSASRHVVVLDLGAVGRGEGMAAARRLREAFPDVRLIALAGEDETRVPELMDAGFRAVLLSPIAAKALQQAVAAAMED